MLGLTNWPRTEWSLFDELESLHDEMNRVLASFSGGRPFFRRSAYPPLNVWISDEGLVVDAELPGVDPKDVEISVLGDELTLRGQIRAEEAPETGAYHQRERPHGEFSRTLRLPFRAEPGGVKATYKNGILRVTVPRHEEEKPRKITVEAA